MNCNCKEHYDKLLSIITTKKKEFEIAYEDGPVQVRKIKFDIIKDMYSQLMKFEKCNCFLGQNMIKMKDILGSFFINEDRIKAEYNETAFVNEKEKLFDKVSLLLNTR